MNVYSHPNEWLACPGNASVEEAEAREECHAN